MANAALVVMRDAKRAITDKLSSQGGANAANAVKSACVHAATKGAHVNNGRVESHFGKADHVMRTYRHSTAEAYSGMVQQAYNHDFDMPLNVASDRRKRKADAPEPSIHGGFFWSNSLMTDELRASLVSAVRKEAENARSEGRKALAEHDAAKLARREERLITALNAAVDYYAYGHELFESWTTQGAKDSKAVDEKLANKPETQQLEYLRHQIDMRVIGFGWNQFKTKWSAKSDPTIGTVARRANSTVIGVVSLPPVVDGLRASASVRVCTRCTVPSGDLMVCCCCAARRAANLGCENATEANGSSAGSSSTLPSAATATITSYVLSSSSFELTMLQSSSIDDLPLSQRSGSVNSVCQSVQTRRRPTISVLSRTRQRNFSRMLSLLAGPWTSE